MTLDVSEIASAGEEISEILVYINYDIIKLFSEGLYRSPNKAIEELVSNSYDAKAGNVHILLPENSGTESLYVIDDGSGMDSKGFHQLWRIAESDKKDSSHSSQRAPIGQFGIGKLAAYVLAQKITYLSCVNHKLLLTETDFSRFENLRQADPSEPVSISLREINKKTAEQWLEKVKRCDPKAWEMMFGEKNRSPNWTVVALSDFREMYARLTKGRLKWVLSTGLPLQSDFKIWLNGEAVESSKVNLKAIRKIKIDHDIPKIGKITGTACIYKKELTGGKSKELMRSHGFFIRVRNRVINLEDELFGIEALNYAAWARFAMEINADGLQDYLLSTRESVKDTMEVEELREFLRKTFNKCRNFYEQWAKEEIGNIDLATLLSDEPSTYITDPLIKLVRNMVDKEQVSFYVDDLEEKDIGDYEKWLDEFNKNVFQKPFANISFRKENDNAPALNYKPGSRDLLINTAHPFIDKITKGGKEQGPAKLFAATEILLEAQLGESWLPQDFAIDLLTTRDRLLRLTAGSGPPTALKVLRMLNVANQNSQALERAVGVVFQVLGFQYDRKGGNLSGPDGVLDAILGVRDKEKKNYRLVYDAKQTNGTSVSADRINCANMDRFCQKAQAHYGFFIAQKYDGEDKPDSKVNEQIKTKYESRLTLLKIEHLQRLIKLHYHYGLTLEDIRLLFKKASTVPEVDNYIEELTVKLKEKGEIPLQVLLDGLEQEKSDDHDTPNVHAVRAKREELKKFESEYLSARLKAVENIIGERWIKVDETSTEVYMYHSAEQIMTELERNIRLLDSEMVDLVPVPVVK